MSLLFHAKITKQKTGKNRKALVTIQYEIDIKF